MSRDNTSGQPRAAETTAPRKSPADIRFMLARHELFATRRGGARADLSSQDLSGVSLPGVNLAGAKLTGTDFSNANLRGAIFDQADLFTANFSGADLTGASFVGADMRGVVLRGARMQQAKLRNADMRAGRLLGASGGAVEACVRTTMALNHTAAPKVLVMMQSAPASA